MSVLWRFGQRGEHIRAKYNKTSQSKVVHEWGIQHDKFLLRLKEATIQEIAFEKSDFCRVLTALQNIPTGYPKRWTRLW